MFGFGDSLEKTQQKLHEVFGGLCMVSCFYTILDAEFKRANVPKDVQIRALGLEPEEGIHYMVVSLKIIGKAIWGLDNLVEVELKNFLDQIYENFKGAFLSSNKEGIDFIIYELPPGNKAWVEKLKKMSPKEAGKMYNVAIAAFNNNAAAKTLLKAFQAPAKYKLESYKTHERRNDVELIALNFMTWSEQGFYHEPEDVDKDQSNLTQNGPFKFEDYTHFKSYTLEQPSFFKTLQTNNDVSQEVYSLFVNIHKTIALFSTIIKSISLPDSLNEAFELPVKTLATMSSMLSSIVGFNQIQVDDIFEFKSHFLFDLVKLLDEELKSEMEKFHVWYLDKIMKFSPEKSMEMEVKAGGDNLKMQSLIVEFFSTPEELYRQSSTEFFRSNDTQDAMFTMLKTALYESLIQIYQTEDFSASIKPIEQLNEVQNNTDSSMTYDKDNEHEERSSGGGAGYL